VPYYTYYIKSLHTPVTPYYTYYIKSLHRVLLSSWAPVTPQPREIEFAHVASNRLIKEHMINLLYRIPVKRSPSACATT